MNRMCVPSRLLLLATGGALLILTACHSPKDSQYYFSKAAAEDPLLEPLHSTPLYTVFYDHGLKRCVLHSAHTWGESGGGGGGTGVGVAVFSCDPIRVKNRSASMRARSKSGRPLDYPTPPQKKIKKPKRCVFGDSGATALIPRQKTLRDHFIQCASDGPLTDTEFLGQLRFAGQEFSRTPMVGGEPCQKRLLDLLVQGSFFHLEYGGSCLALGLRLD